MLNPIPKSYFSYKVFKTPIYKNILNTTLNTRISNILNDKFKSIQIANNVLDDNFLMTHFSHTKDENEKFQIKCQYYNMIALKKLGISTNAHAITPVGSPDIEGMLDEKFSACDFVVELKPQEKTTIINIGCSNGEDLFKMSAILSSKELIISNCIGYDINPIAIEQAKESVEILNKEGNALGGFEFQTKREKQ